MSTTPDVPSDVVTSALVDIATRLADRDDHEPDGGHWRGLTADATTVSGAWHPSAGLPMAFHAVVVAGPPDMTVVAGQCPACGGTLYLGAGGHVICPRLACPDPVAADRLLHGEPGPWPLGTA